MNRLVSGYPIDINYFFVIKRAILIFIKFKKKRLFVNIILETKGMKQECYLKGVFKNTKIFLKIKNNGQIVHMSLIDTILK